MKKFRLCALITALLFILCSCWLENGYGGDSGDDSAAAYERQLELKDKYLEALTEISKTFMPANFMVYRSSRKGLLAEKVQGSGVIYKRTAELTGYRYYLLTNHHVTKPSQGYHSSSYELVDYKDHSYPNGRLEYEDIKYDLSVISFYSDTDYYIPQTAENNPETGEGVFAVGQPMGQRNAVTFGYVKFYFLETFDWCEIDFPTLFHTAYMQTGNSGGVLLNADLQIAGINFAAGAYGTDADGENAISVSVPIERVKEFLEKMELAALEEAS